MKNPFSLEGKIALVTGASYGIGFAIASGFAEAGAKIVFNDINQELVDKGIAAYKEKGIDAKGYVCDVTDEDAVMVDYQMDDVYSTSVEARKRYRNLWYTLRKQGINDFTEKGILFYMGGSEESGDDDGNQN